MICEFLCAKVEARTGRKIVDQKLFCEILGDMYMSSTLYKSCENFVQNAKDMICNEDDSDSPMPVICELINESLQSGIEYDRKRFYSLLNMVYLSYQRNHEKTERDEYTDYARSMIHSAVKRKEWNDQSSDSSD